MLKGVIWYCSRDTTVPQHYRRPAYNQFIIYCIINDFHEHIIRHLAVMYNWGKDILSLLPAGRRI